MLIFFINDLPHLLQMEYFHLVCIISCNFKQLDFFLILEFIVLGINPSPCSGARVWAEPCAHASRWKRSVVYVLSSYIYDSVSFCSCGGTASFCLFLYVCTVVLKAFAFFFLFVLFNWNCLFVSLCLCYNSKNAKYFAENACVCGSEPKYRMIISFFPQW